MSLISLARRGRAVALVTGALMLVPLVAEARPGGGRSRGACRRAGSAAPRPGTGAALLLLERRAQDRRGIEFLHPDEPGPPAGDLRTGGEHDVLADHRNSLPRKLKRGGRLAASNKNAAGISRRRCFSWLLWS